MTLAVVPVLFGPIQVLLALLPALLMFLGGAFIALFKPSTFKQSVRLFWRLKVPLLVGAAFLYGCVWTVRAMLPKPVAAHAEETKLDWPQFRGGPKRQGAVPGSPPPLSGGVNWSFAGEMKKFFSSPTIVGNRVYCTGSDYTALSNKGAVFCLDADTGALVWQSIPKDFRATFSSPSVSGKYLVVGEGLHMTRDARVFCLDIEHEGKVLWSHATTNHVESSACIADGRVCIGAGDDGYYCFALEPKSDGSPNMLWHAEHARCPDAECSPAFDDGKFYVGLGLRGNALLCLDAKSGAEVWRVATPYPVFAPPTVANGKLYIGMGNGNFAEDADEAAVKELAKLKEEGANPAQLAEAREKLKAGGEVWCIDLGAKHEVLWQFKVPQVVLGAVVVADDGKTYFGARDGFLYALSPAGKELGRTDAHAPILASPSVLGDYVYVVTKKGRILACNRHNLQGEWSAPLGGDPTLDVISSPAVARSHIYVGSLGDGLRCLGAPAEQKVDAGWAGASGGPGKPGHLGEAELPERGSIIWRWPESGDTSKINAPVAFYGNLICVPVAEGPKAGIVALENSPEATTAPTERWHFPAPGGVWNSPAIVPSLDPKRPSAILFITGKSDGVDRHLHCVDSFSGVERWKAPLAPDASGAFSVLNGKIFFSPTRKLFVCQQLDGKVLWKQPFDVLGVAASHHDIAVISLATPTWLVALDLPTGRELWRVDVPVITGPIIERDTIFVGTREGIRALKLIDGSTLWNAPTSEIAQPLLLLDDRIATVTTAGDVLIVDAKKGGVLSKFPDANPAFSPLLAQDAVYFAGKELMRGDFTQQNAQRWMTAARLGNITAPPVSANNAIFFATTTRGLIKAGRTK